jgi:hypothetical protein
MMRGDANDEMNESLLVITEVYYRDTLKRLELVNLLQIKRVTDDEDNRARYPNSCI